MISKENRNQEVRKRQLQFWGIFPGGKWRINYDDEEEEDDDDDDGENRLSNI